MVEDEFKQLMEKTPLQHVNSGRKLLILVMSPRENVDQRRAIRETWAKDSPNVFFLVSKKYCPYPSSWLKFGPDGPCTLEEDYSEKIARNALSESESELLTEIKEIQAKLTKVIEQEENVGLLESTDSDSDGALRAKLAFEWAYEHTDFNAETAGGESEQEEELLYGLEHEDSKLRFFPGLESSPPSWILKTDDDCIVRPESYERMLAANFNGTRYFHHGISERPDTRLGYVLSMDLIKHLYSTLQEVEADQYEDEASAVTAWLEVEPEDEIEYVVTDSNQLVLLENSINSQACQPSESPDQHPEYDADTGWGCDF